MVIPVNAPWAAPVEDTLEVAMFFMVFPLTNDKPVKPASSMSIRFARTAPPGPAVAENVVTLPPHSGAVPPIKLFTILIELPPVLVQIAV